SIGVTVRIASRGSALALWQAEQVVAYLRSVGAAAEIVVVSTEGDRRTDVALSEIGGKGVFVKEVQAAVLDGRADVAVHSTKDLPALTPESLTIAAFPQRADVRDAIVGLPLADLGAGHTIATGAPRRHAQLAGLCPDAQIVELRGNIATRLDKLAEVDAVVVAAAALERLQIVRTDVDFLDPSTMIPQVGQGALAIECAVADTDLVEIFGGLDHPETRRCVETERAFLQRLGGDCELPAGGYAVLDGPEIVLTAMLATDGDCHRLVQRGTEPHALGVSIADHLLAETS
ncbi:UNVERIFIED_CONTAM: hypothetical protein GTU68_028053, partial [Idotea baltica]|nr:hypothetical protein [Idotea baltica]